jgi:uncharacterized protein (TIGR02599 family)
MRKTGRFSPHGFSLLELLVATTVLIIIMGVIISLTGQINRAWAYSSAKVESFQDARFAFETITRAVSGATLNTYYDYYGTNHERRTNATGFTPSTYGRCSELEFVTGKNLVPGQVTHAAFFQTPLDYTQTPNYSHLGGLLNALGVFIKFDKEDDATRPSFAPSQNHRYRYRLMELHQPTENLSVYSTNNSHDWFVSPLSASSPPARVLAENIIACVIWPKLPEETQTNTSFLSSNFEYDSVIANAQPDPLFLNGDNPAAWPPNKKSQPPNMNQLPPVVRIVLVATDERSMLRLQAASTIAPDLGFDYSKVFQKSSNLDADLKTVGDALASKNINYRIFQTDVAIQGAKWSP